MMIGERIQAVIHKLEVDAGARWLNWLVLALAVVAVTVWYDTHCYHSFNSPEAMDAAQVGRNLAQGRGFTTECLRPFSIYLMQRHTHATVGNPGTNFVDYGHVYGPHPDLANAPLYPLVLAGLFKMTSPHWKLELEKPFWGGGGRFQRYRPEFTIAIFNQVLLLLAVILTYALARTLFDTAAAWLAAVLMLGADHLWKFSVSGLPTLLLLVIFLGLVWCLVWFEKVSQMENPDQRWKFGLAILAGALAGLGALTQYSFGWVILPVSLYFVFFGGTRRAGLAVAAVLVFGGVIAPWILRNFMVSGTLLGTAGYAPVEDSMSFPGSRLAQSLNPDLTSVYWVSPYLVKLQSGLRVLLRDSIPRLGGGWIGCLFLAGLLLGLRNVMARRLRYFSMMCLGVFLVVTALGRTSLGAMAVETNEENLLVLLTPLIIVFGLALFLTLLDQMNVPLPAMRFGVMGLVAVLACHQFLLSLLPPRTHLISYPPYNPQELQSLSQWIQPDELMMSDLPWAVAWYADRPCVWTTPNAGPDFFQLNDYVKHISAVYLSEQTMDGRLLSDCLQGGRDNWNAFVLGHLTVQKRKINDSEETMSFLLKSGSEDPRNSFPLRYMPPINLTSGFFLADRPRW